jgi:hypothetical protein
VKQTITLFPAFCAHICNVSITSASVVRQSVPLETARQRRGEAAAVHSIQSATVAMTNATGTRRPAAPRSLCILLPAFPGVSVPAHATAAFKLSSCTPPAQLLQLLVREAAANPRALTGASQRFSQHQRLCLLPGPRAERLTLNAALLGPLPPSA